MPLRPVEKTKAREMLPSAMLPASAAVARRRSEGMTREVAPAAVVVDVIGVRCNSVDEAGVEVREGSRKWPSRSPSRKERLTKRVEQRWATAWWRRWLSVALRGKPADSGRRGRG